MSNYIAIYKCKRCGITVKKENIFSITGEIVEGMIQMVEAHYCDAEEKKIGVVELIGSDI